MPAARVLPPLCNTPAGTWCAQPLLPDQTYANLWPDGANTAAPAADDAEQPARMVGVGSLGEPEWLPLALAAGGVLLLVSDGLHAVLSGADWHAALASHLGSDAHTLAGAAQPQHRLLALAELLIQTAIQRGSEDDITVLALMRCTPTTQEEPRP